MTTRLMQLVPAVFLITALLGADAAQAFCFLKNQERRGGYDFSRMPAIGFAPDIYRNYQYSALPRGWYAGPLMQPQPSPYADSGYVSRNGLQQR